MCMRYLEQTACLFAAKMLFVNEEEDTCHMRRRIHVYEVLGTNSMFVCS
jgi:hypothetical protein